LQSTYCERKRPVPPNAIQVFFGPKIGFKDRLFQFRRFVDGGSLDHDLYVQKIPRETLIKLSAFHNRSR
jgi:hypothetical protein